MGLVSELRRRNVFRVAIAYVVIAWLIMQVGDTLAPALHLAEWVNSVLVFFLILGFPLAVFFAWAYELTPEGIKLEKDVDRGQSITHVTGRKLNYFIIAALAVALVFFAFDKWVLDPVRDAELVQATAEAVSEGEDETVDRSIAVLPFVNMSADPDNEYFSDGISEEIRNLLVKTPDLRVSSRSSAFSFKGQNVDVPTMAAKLNVAHVLEGSVRKAGDQLRITAQLIEVATDTQLWSGTFERELDSIFEIQNEIATEVVAGLKVTLLGETAEQLAIGQTDNVDAFQLYLQGRYFWRRRNAEDLLRARQLLEQAVAMDPGYANAMTALAATYVVIPSYSNVSSADYYAMASEMAQRALEIDPTQAEAYAVLSSVGFGEGRWADAFERIQKSIELDPQNATAHHWAYIGYISAGRLRDAHQQITEAYRLDPLNAAIAGSVAWSFSVQGDYESAISMLETAEELGWGDFAKPYIALNYALLGDTQTAAELYAGYGSTRHFSDFDWAPSFLDALTNPEHVEEFTETMLAAVIEGRAAPVPTYPMLALVGSEKFKDVFDMDLRDDTYIWSLWYQKASAARRTPAFRDLVSEIGLLPFWQESDQWPDLCRPAETEAFECD
jgi:TolB-like protein